MAIKRHVSPLPQVRKGIEHALIMHYNGYKKLQIGTVTSSKSTQPINCIRIDNETSKRLETLFITHNLQVQHVLIHLNRSNKAERGVQSSKNHIIAALLEANPTFSWDKHWDKLLPQLKLTLFVLTP